MKITPVIGWLIGAAVAAVAFFTLGIWILFAMSYGMIHSDAHDATKVIAILGTWVAVLFGTFRFALAIKRTITSKPDTECGD